MPTPPSLFGLAAFFASILCSPIGLSQSLPGPQVSSASPAPAKATAAVDFGNSRSLTTKIRQGSSQLIGLQPNQIVNVSLKVSPSKVGHIITLQPLDGGRVIGTTSQCVVGADGTFGFKFQAGPNPGVSQISIRDGSEEIGLPFWVLNTQDAQRNPPVLTPENSNL